MPSFAYGLLSWFQALAISAAETAVDVSGCVELHNAQPTDRETLNCRGELAPAEANDPYQSCERPLGATVHGTPIDGMLATEVDRLPEFRSDVGIMLLNQHDQVFLARRAKTPDGTWQMPQGCIDDGEEALAAALRGLREQIGADNVEVLAESKTWLRYELPPRLIGKAWQGRWRGQQQKWFVMRYLGSDADINITTEHPKFSAWCWVSASELPNLIASFKRQIYLDVLEQFRTFGAVRSASGRAVASRSAKAQVDP